jgi:2-oxoglutarate/2-oxoacid ferredoxin oxidoreductase subunit alpha
MEGAQIGLIAFGSTDPAIQEARYYLASQGVPTDYLRVRSVPFSSEVSDFIREHDRNYVIELNRDGQLHQLLTLEVPKHAASLISLAHIDGLPLTSKWVEKALLSKEETL